MKILITGGSGFLGQYLNHRLALNHIILTVFNEHNGNCDHFNSKKLDIRDKDLLYNIFNSFLPEVVIHTAAVSQTVSNRPAKMFYSVNVEATKSIAELCRDFNSKLIYTSTDLVYAGYRGSLLNEDAKLIPVSLYAETKLMGEQKIKETFDNFLILRTALLYGFGLNHSVPHFHLIYKDLKEGKKVNLFTDQFRTPLGVIEAAEIIEKLCAMNFSGEVMNFGGTERVSRFELGEKLCDAAGFNKNLLVPIKMTDIPGLPVVEDVSMNTDKLRSFGIKQKPINVSIRNMLKDL